MEGGWGASALVAYDAAGGAAAQGRNAEVAGDDRVRIVEMFSLVLKFEAFWTIDSDGRKSYRKGKHIQWDVEVGSLTVENLMQSVSNEVECGENQCATVWFYDKTMEEDVRIVDDVQMATFFDMYKTEMQCQLVVSVLDKSLCEAHEFDYLEPICVLPSDDANQTAENHTAAQPNQNTSEP
ncbi:unnamed protein product, partial [Urochloa humidicola]